MPERDGGTRFNLGINQSSLGVKSQGKGRAILSFPYF